MFNLFTRSKLNKRDKICFAKGILAYIYIHKISQNKITKYTVIKKEKLKICVYSNHVSIKFSPPFSVNLVISGSEFSILWLIC